MTESPDNPRPASGGPPGPGDAAGDPNLNWVWAGAGFLFVLLAGAVVWLAVIVADLRGDAPGELEVVQTAALTDVDTPPPSTNQGRRMTDKNTAPIPIPTKNADDVDAPAAGDKGVIKTTAGELGIPGLPADREVHAVIDGDYESGRDQVGTKDGFVSREAFEKEGFPMRKFPFTKQEFRSKLSEKFPNTTTTLSPDEVGRFGEVVREQYASEAAILHVLKGQMSQEDMGNVLDTLGKAVAQKWEQVGPASSPEDFARADELVMRAARESLPPTMVNQMETSLQTGAAFAELPEEGDLQEIAWVARSLMNNGLTNTVNESDTMRQEVNIPPPPPGISEDDPEYKKYVEEQRESYRKARAMARERAPKAP